MKKLSILLLFAAFSIINAQFKNQTNDLVDIRSSMINNNTSNLLFGFFNPANFQMHHSFSMSYSTFGGGGLALSTYTNSMFYKFNDKLNLQADISVVNSPYNTFGSQFTKQLNGIYLSRAMLNYTPTKNMSISIEYNHLPYNPYYYGYDPFFRSNYFFNNPPNEK
ncbi:hypothetical protein ABRY23_07985 [Melioribacteraceae bacterium 4301-Me]|uniref:hypothetical protein n=1 Tax=Pyranulibacter aquaticus TaxID=3163344 RepID=UPI00359A928C